MHRLLRKSGKTVVLTLGAVIALSMPVGPTPAADAAPTDAVTELVSTLSPSGWTDDELVKLSAALTAQGANASRSSVLMDAVLNPTFPKEGRPDRFYDTLASYYDPNRDGSFSAAEIDAVIKEHATRYIDLLREDSGKGPHQNLAGTFRVKTWKMMQKILLLKQDLGKRSLKEWSYKPMTPQHAVEAWDDQNTLDDAADFRTRVCQASAQKPVVVKFGSTQCADCLLMEYTQGIRLAAEKVKGRAQLYKFWWGPNLPAGNDTLRKSEGVDSSPFFVVYRNGRRYPCGFEFLDDQGAGLDECLDRTLREDAKAAGSCGEAAS